MSDIRWEQRFDNFQRAFHALTRAVELSAQRPLTDLEEQGLIQSFEFTHELAWNVLKDYLEDKGFSNIIGSKDATRLAFKNNMIEDGEAWMKMIEDRNRTSHTYNLQIAKEVVSNILHRFFPEFKGFCDRFSKLMKQTEGN